MRKIINLKPEEDVTSVVERLWETGAEEIFLVAPKKSSLLTNIVALKLLKREADRLRKTVILITKDEVDREMAKRAGLTSRVSLPKEELVKEELPEEEEEVLREMPPQKFESLLKAQVRLKRQAAPRSFKMSDIQPKSVITPPPEKLSEAEKEEEKEDLLTQAVYESESSETEKYEETLEQPEPVSDETGLPFGEPAKIPPVSIGPEPVEEQFPEKEEEFPVRLMLKEQKEPKKKLGFLKRLSFWKKKVIAPVKEEYRQAPRSPFSLKFVSLLVVAAILLAGLALYFILPKVEIVVTPRTEAFSEELTITVDKGIGRMDLAAGKISAQLLKLDKKLSKDFLATSQQQLNEKARGIITVYNEYSSSSQGLVEKTRFVSEDGKVFRLTKSILVPGAKIEEGKIVASTIDAEVVADQPGQEYNIGPSRFTIPGFLGSPKYDGFYGRSKNAMIGGAVGLFKVVSQEDFDKAKADLWSILKPALDQEFKAQIPKGLKLLGEALKEEIGDVSSSVEVGEQAERFTLTIKGTATVLLFDEKDIFELLKNKLSERLGNNKELSKEELKTEYQNIQVDFGKGQLSFRAKFSGKIIWKIDLEKLKVIIAGKKEVEVKQIFKQHSEIDRAKVTFWPVWVSAVPSNLDKIKITSEF